MCEENMGNDVSITFKVSEEMARMLSQVAFDNDESKSTIIRKALIAGLALLEGAPGLFHRARIDDLKAIRQR